MTTFLKGILLGAGVTALVAAVLIYVILVRQMQNSGAAELTVLISHYQLMDKPDTLKQLTRNELTCLHDTLAKHQDNWASLNDDFMRRTLQQAQQIIERDHLTCFNFSRE